MKNLITRTITGILYVGLLCGCILAEDRFFLYTLCLIFTLLGTHEYVRLYKNRNSRPLYLGTVLLAFISFNLLAYPVLFIKDLSWHTFIPSFVAVFIIIDSLFFMELFRKQSRPFSNIALSILPLFWIVLPLAMIAAFPEKKIILLLFITIWIYDTFAYVTGSLFGKHRLLKRVSPKKSWEGFILSTILTLVFAAFINQCPYFSSLEISTLNWMVFCFIIIILGTVGDLAESLLKRKFEVKDSGKILPGHGGVLDRLDSVLFAAPLALLYMLYILKYCL